jgi:hypothetical protein
LNFARLRLAARFACVDGESVDLEIGLLAR